MDGHFFLDKEGPYKTMNDLWDGERSIPCVHVHGSVCHRQRGDASGTSPRACLPSKVCMVLHASSHHRAAQPAACEYALIPC